MFKQAVDTTRIITSDRAVRERVLRELAHRMDTVSLDKPPAISSRIVYDIITEITGEKDPYREKKKITNREALQLLPDLEKTVLASSDPLRAAVHLAVAGNVIDFGAGHSFDIKKDIGEIMKKPFTIDDIEKFERDLSPGKTLLYMGDNSGEIVLDTLMVKEILKRGTDVIFVVKSGPIINDATMEDAEAAGLTSLVKVIETGSDDMGINWERCSEELRSRFEKADIIISKGQANFETLSERKENIYFLLKAKCSSIAEELGVKPMDMVFLKNKANL